MKLLKKLTWPAVLKAIVGIYLCLGTAIAIFTYQDMRRALEECAVQSKELQEILDSYCSDSEVRILLCPDRIDGCFCIPIISKDASFKEEDE